MAAPIASFRTERLASARMRVRLALMARSDEESWVNSRAQMFGLPPEPKFGRRSGRSLSLIATPDVVSDAAEIRRR
jgi:hypothetical protein